MKCLFQAPSWKKMHHTHENPTKLLKKIFSTIKKNKIILKNRKDFTILSPVPLPSVKNEHTISIEEKALKQSFERSFMSKHI